jgi:hypothetical protein
LQVEVLHFSDSSAAFNLYTLHLQSLQFYPAFMCERDQWKAEWLAQTFPGVKAVFSDMKDLYKKEAHDFISDKKVKVPSVS